jgi:hypothetical protein
MHTTYPKEVISPSELPSSAVAINLSTMANKKQGEMSANKGTKKEE